MECNTPEYGGEKGCREEPVRRQITVKTPTASGWRKSDDDSNGNVDDNGDDDDEDQEVDANGKDEDTDDDEVIAQCAY